MLTEGDLREKPLELQCLGDIKRLASAICKLRAHFTPTERMQCCGEMSQGSSNGQIIYLDNDSLTKRPNDLLVCVSYKDGVVPIASADPRVLDKTSGTAERVLGEIAADSSGEGRLKRIHLLSREDLIRQVCL
ncbi:unnamed protein product [Gongylonema pulchrum]|uniref:START domain-containing protein n=1 Tax=Gongylonema pulchrum TaxID=637853 RepID=A0A183EHX0_9BILA|nr:unnamed protein product [Gongylonema pulchrum]